MRTFPWLVVASLVIASGCIGGSGDAVPEGGNEPTPKSVGPPANVSESPAPAPASPESPPPEEPADPAPAARAPLRVVMRDDAFHPARIEVQEGDEVVWVNEDDRPHTATATDGSWDSGHVREQANHSRVFAEAGTYPYFCRYHSDMTGEVVVIANASSSPSATGDEASPAPTSGPSEEPATTPEATDAPAEVAIEASAFSPASLSVPAGTRVTWTNRDAAPHTVTAREDEFDSGTLRQGETYSRTFSTPGRYEYRCDFHSDMRATLTVT